MRQLAIRLSWQTTPAKSLVMFERAARVPQPPDLSSNAGNRAAAVSWGRFLLVTFLGKTRKVTSSRATPGGFVYFETKELSCNAKTSSSPPHLC